LTILMNLVWILLGGWLAAAAWAAIGLLWSVTIVGLPVGTQCFKFAVMSLVPSDMKCFSAAEPARCCSMSCGWPLAGSSLPHSIL